MRLFGANRHRYRFRRMDEGELQRFEVALRITLPEGFRTHLRELGAGAGPHYGIFGLDRIRAELHDISEDAREYEQRVPDPAGEFPLTAEQAAATEWGDVFKPVEHTLACDGWLPIAFGGCTYWSVLVITGPLRGRVWDYDNSRGIEGRWLPGIIGLDRPEEEPPLFTDWYEAWIRHAQAELRWR